MAGTSEPAVPGWRGRFASAVYWSVIPAAFIGPGTVTSCAAAGAGYGFTLLWTMTFSTIACIALQETVARAAVGSGRDLGPLIASRFGRGVGLAVAGAVVVGCAAYETGNLLGSGAGLQLVAGGNSAYWIAASTTAAGVVLWRGTPGVVANIMGALVALMGFAFVATAVGLRPDAGAVARGLVVPALPEGSLGTAVALVGTTVVPYNLFLGAGLAKARGVRPRGEARFGIVVAVGVGGLISAAIIVAGTAVQGELTYSGLAAALADRLGAWAPHLLAVGLFGAGFSSAITAPLAAGMALRVAWSGVSPEVSARRERAVRMIVLAVGAGFALANTKPIPAIIAAQALNGVVLPLVAAFALLVANDARSVGRAALNGRVANVFGAIVVFVATTLGVAQLAKTGADVGGFTPPSAQILVGASAVIAVAPVAYIFLRARTLRGG
jgi:manganese transport protein